MQLAPGAGEDGAVRETSDIGGSAGRSRTAERKVIELEREAVNSIAEIFAGQAAEGFILTYADKVDVLQDWTPLGPELQQVSPRIELDTASSNSPRTLLNDALQTALQRLDARQGVDLKVLIVVGEGNDWVSSARVSRSRSWRGPPTFSALRCW